MNRVFRDARVRAVAMCVGALVMTQFLLPGGGGGRGTPLAVLFNGAVFGSLNALTAVGLVLIYRTNRVLNFAQAAMGAAGGEFTFQLLELTKVPFLVAFLIGVLTAALIGLIFELAVVRRFFRAPRLVLTIATIAAASVLSKTAPSVIRGLPFLPKTNSVDAINGTVDLRPKLPFKAFQFSIGALRLHFGFAELFSIGIALAMIVGLGAFLRYARVGVAIRALAENLDRASLLGIGTGMVSSTVWTLAGALSGTGAILLGVLTTPGSARSPGPTVLLPALAAAVLARMERIPTAVLASFLLAMVRAAFLFSFRLDTPLVDFALFAVVVIGLLAQRRVWSRSEEGSGVTWEATREQRAIPRVLAVLPSIRATKVVAAATAVGAVILFPLLASPARVAIGSAAALHITIALSVLVLTGWGGQVSLGQYGFAAIGAVLTAALASTVGLPFFLAIPLGVALTGGIAALVGIPALRIKGLFLAAATFAFAIAVHSVVLNRRYFGWLIPASVARPRFLLLDFEDERSMYYLCVLSMVAAILLIGNLRRSRFGRLLIAARENDANLDSLGISAVRLKIIAFAISGGFAGLGGALLTYVLRGVSADAFVPDRSLTVFMLSVLGGVGSVAGVMLGVAYEELRGVYLQGTGFVNLVFSVIQPFSVLILLYVEPTGLIGLVNRMRDGVLRIIAQRRQLVVPSLFADYDPAAIEKRLIPLGARISGSGLAAIRRTAPYALPSRRYTDAGPRLVGGAPRPTRVDESASTNPSDVIAAAAKSNEAALAAQAVANGALASTGGAP